VLRKATQLRPDDAAAHRLLAVALRATGERDEAMATCRQAVAVALPTAERRSLGHALSATGGWAAVGNCYLVIAPDPEIASAYHGIGHILNDAEDWAGAADALRKAVAFDPLVAVYHHDLAVALRASGKLPEAIAEFRRAIAIEPSKASYHYNLGNALQQNK